MFTGLPERIDAVFYMCDYLKECDKVTHHNADVGETAAAANAKKKQQLEQEELSLGVRNSTVNLG